MEILKRDDFLERPNFPCTSSIQQGDEIDRLRVTFYEMSDRIIQQMKKLREIDALRRELVANALHDLRTPLASLQGYLETLFLKHGKLTSQEQQNYLEIALRHSNRLRKLISELFELAKLDSHEIQLHIEPFSLSELVRDVVQKFQLVAEKKKIRLQATLQKIFRLSQPISDS